MSEGPLGMQEILNNVYKSLNKSGDNVAGLVLLNYVWNPNTNQWIRDEGNAMAVWGDITGTLSNQTDLQTALNALMPLAGGTLTGTLTSQTIAPSANTTYNLGSTSDYYQYTYSQRYYLNPTAYIDGGTAGLSSVTGGLEVTVGSGGNQRGLYVIQNDTTNNPMAIYVQTTGTAEAFRFEQNGVLAANKTCFAIFSSQSHVSSNSYLFKMENTSTSSSIPMADFEQSGTAPTLILQSLTAANSNAHVLQMRLPISATQKFIECLTNFSGMFTVNNDGTVYAGNTVQANGGYLSSDGTAGLTQASTTTLGKSITVKNGLIVAFA